MSTFANFAVSTTWGRFVQAILCLTMATPVFAASTDLATAPLVTSSSTVVAPNVFVMMDDSGSMDWDFLPDNIGVAFFALGTFGYGSAQCNGVAYNPNVTYTPPVKSTGTPYANASFTNAPVDGFGIASTATVNLSTSFREGIYADNTSSSAVSGASLLPAAPAYYYTYTGTQTSGYQKSFINTSSQFYNECSSSPPAYQTKFKISTTSGGSGNTGITSIVVNGTSIMASAGTVQYPGRLGAEIIANLTAAGYSASCTSGTCNSSTSSTSSVTVQLVGPATASGNLPVITKSGGNILTIATPPAFTSVPFTTVLVSSTSGPGGTDETQNFANWYSYYRTRVNMMKTGLGQSFQTIGSNYRVGFATMNNNSGSDFVNLATFNASQKLSWYNMVYGVTTGGGTGLIDALAKVGKMYAYKLSSNKLNGVTATDPIQYSCQQNFTLLSTDGYWNAASTTASLGGTAVGNQDNGTATATGGGANTAIPALRPYCDGASTCSGSSSSGSGTSNTLADVAMYYYANALRTTALGNCTSASSTNNVCCTVAGSDCNVPTTAQDTAWWQHMNLFTIGLGAPGYMVFDPNYASESAGSVIHDYYDVANGVPASNMSGTTPCTGATCHCPWYTVGSPYKNQPSGSAGMPCEWPTPDVSGIPANIDDLWHAAVNGHGSYFSATDPNALAVGLSTALAAVQQATGNSAAATTSTPNVTSTNNFVFASTYTSALWDGELSELSVNVTTGGLNTQTVAGVTSNVTLWTVAAPLDAVTYTSRTIYYNNAGTLTNFFSSGALNWTALSATQQAYFTTPHISTLSQFCGAGTTCLTAAQQTSASGQPLLDFILGDRSNEGLTNANYFRVRTHVLGDIVDSQASFVGAPPYQYTDSGYSTFVSSNSSRQGAVYVGANDGMLHAFNANTGAELWSFVPTAVMPNLYMLADKNYAALHQFYVDGTPVTGDVYYANAWHTILVGGLNDGGQGYYALDVTNPAAPALLWEFTNTNLGYSYGNPIITKLQNGTWVVAIASGYNNNVSGDGKGHLFVLNAQTGAIITTSTTTTPAGSTTTPSGLARISGWANYPLTDNTTLYVYGGDLLGNLWRFDINGGTAPQLLVTLKDASGNAQPITDEPELGLVNGSTKVVHVVFVGTGEYLGANDLTNTNQQSFYAVNDPLTIVTGAIYTTAPQATGSKFIQQTLTVGTCPTGESATVCSPGQAVITGTSNPVDFSIDSGWYVNFPNTGERDNTDPTLALGSIIVNTNIPSSSACTAGGNSFEYQFNFATGGPVNGAGSVVAVSQGNVISASATVYQTPAGGIDVLQSRSNGTFTTNGGWQSGGSTSNTRRVGWHETN